MTTENTLDCIRGNPKTLGVIQGKIREILIHHKLTEVGDINGVILGEHLLKMSKSQRLSLGNKL